MDEEDLREAEEARTLKTATDFAGFGSTATDPNRVGGLMDILRASGETIGVKLLKRMGWKEGQGIGPKVRRKADLGNGEDAGGETYLFAPQNTPVVSFPRKNDSKGLGFDGESPLNAPRVDGEEDDDGADIRVKLLRNGGKRGTSDQRKRGGIGVGILNDTGSDDEDPYEIGPKISYNRVINQDKKLKQKNPEMQRTARAANPLLNNRPVFISKKKAAIGKTNAGFRKCHDGRLPLEGFLLGLTLSDTPDQMERYAPPKIPEGWKSSKAAATTRDVPTYVSTAEAAKASSLDPKSRAAILGERQLPGKSVFDYMTPESRARLVKVTGRTDLPPALGEKPPKGFETSETQKTRDLWNVVPKLDKNVATQALSRGVGGWSPYMEDPDKRERYRTFLEIQAGLKGGLPKRVPGISTEEWVAELYEFVRAAEVFKPMTGMMASRFTSSSSLPQSSESEEATVLRKPTTKPEDPAEAAAKLGMYGPMTRTTLRFAPARLLCKRFNVQSLAIYESSARERRGTSSETQAASSASKLELVSKDVMAKLMMESRASGRQASSARESPAATTSVQPPSPPPQAEPPRVQVDPERNEALEAARPGEEVFKAVFGSDNEDEE
jgi:G patch domain-containing protein 1